MAELKTEARPPRRPVAVPQLPQRVGAAAVPRGAVRLRQRRRRARRRHPRRCPHPTADGGSAATPPRKWIARHGHYPDAHGRTDDSRRPQAQRRTVRLRTVEGAARAIAGTGPCRRPLRNVAPAGTGKEPGRPRPRRRPAAVLSARRLRGDPRQRRLYRVLGRGGVRAHRQALAAPDLRRVQLEVRLRGGQESVRRRPGHRQGRPGQRPQAAVGPVRRRHRLGAQRDVDRGGRSRATARGFRRRTHRHRRHLGGRRPAGGHHRCRRVLLCAAEEFRR